MHLIRKKPVTDIDSTRSAANIQQLRQTNNLLSPGQLKTGCYYIYKEKFGMVAVVKILEATSQGDWIGYRLKVSRVIFSPWQVPVGYIFETGYCSKTTPSPSAWHFETGLHLVKTDKPQRYVIDTDTADTKSESVL